MQPVASTMGVVHTSHSTNMHSQKCEILFFQKMECFFTQNGKPKKVECVVYCQKFKELPMSLDTLVTNIKQTDWLSVEFMSYLMMFMLMLFFFITSRLCTPQQQELAQQKDVLSLTDKICINRNQLVLNFGALSLCMMVVKSFYKKFT